MSRAEITLSKRRELISWHSVREAISDGCLEVFKDPRETNLAGILANQFPVQRREDMLIRFTIAVVNLSEIKSDTDYHR